jgi:alcohol dehydrogenase class IV
VSHVATLLEIVKRRELKKLNTFLCFFDFEKAYDNIAHDLLFKKMEKMNINKAIINVIKQLYKNTRMRIRMGDTKSSEYAYKKWVRQGCHCSPTLFNIFVNDVFDQMEGIIVPGLDHTVPGLLFADG